MIRLRNRLINRINFILPFVFFLLVFFLTSPFLLTTSFAATINGADYSCSDLIPADGDVLSGTFTNVTNFFINDGVTIFVEPGTTLSINAESIDIQGTLYGVGAGYPGGLPSLDPASAGSPGEGPGGGEGGQHGACIHSSGGGGGAYGGNGGNSSSLFGSNPPQALGGTAYGSPNTPGVEMGSGGGAAGNNCEGSGTGGAGGAGGAAISLISNNINISGNIIADGAPGAIGIESNAGAPGGGGGAGGGVEICGQSGSITGTLSANGGKGADGVNTLSSFAQGGGGGGGGRIKISASINTSGATIIASEGLHGAYSIVIPDNIPSTDGQIGTVYLNGSSCDSSCSGAINAAIPTLSEWGMIIMSLMLSGSAFWVMRRRQMS